MPFSKSKKLHDEASLFEYAVGALGRRMRTVAELKRLMRQKMILGDKEAVIGNVVAKLKDLRYLDDSHYAALYTSSRKDNNKFGRQRVITDLKTKGVHPEVIEKSVTAAYDGVDEEQLAREYLKRKRIPQPTVAKRADVAGMKKSQKESARVFRTLVRAGFRSQVIIRVLKKWDVEDELLLALEEE